MIHAEVLPEEQVACLRGLAPAATALGVKRDLRDMVRQAVRDQRISQ